MDETGSAAMPQREAQILALLAEGKTNDQIAELIGTSKRTVSNQIVTIYLRLGVDNRVEAARWYWEHREHAA